MKRVLLAVSGLTPQIVTETIYALSRRPEPWIPDEVHLVTTAEGARRARLQLLARETRWLHRLCEEYGLPEPRFDNSCIHVLTDASGRPLDDIRTPEDNAAVADAIFEIVRALTADPDTGLHASIAGGRKTMGFYLGYAMSLLGRPGDVLSHVLVSPPYESIPDFFYPSRTERIVFDRDNTPLDASQAVVSLAEIPFVRMREGLVEALGEGKMRFGEAVALASRVFARPEVELDCAAHSLRTPAGRVELPPTGFAFYLWLARKRQRRAVALCPQGDDALGREPEAGREILALYRDILPKGRHERTEVQLAQGLTKSWFEQTKSRVNRRLREAFGTGSPYEIVRRRRGGRYEFGLFGLEPENIRERSS